MNFLCLFQPFGHVVKCLWSSREDFLVYFLQQMLFFHPFSTLLSSSQMKARFLGKSSFHFCVFFPPSSSSFFLLFASNVCSSFFYLLCVYIFEGIFFPVAKWEASLVFVQYVIIECQFYILWEILISWTLNKNNKKWKKEIGRRHTHDR